MRMVLLTQTVAFERLMDSGLSYCYTPLLMFNYPTNFAIYSEDIMMVNMAFPMAIVRPMLFVPCPMEPPLKADMIPLWSEFTI